MPFGETPRIEGAKTTGFRIVRQEAPKMETTEARSEARVEKAVESPERQLERAAQAERMQAEAGLKLVMERRIPAAQREMDVAEYDAKNAKVPALAERFSQIAQEKGAKLAYEKKAADAAAERVRAVRAFEAMHAKYAGKNDAELQGFEDAAWDAKGTPEERKQAEARALEIGKYRSMRSALERRIRAEQPRGETRLAV